MKISNFKEIKYLFFNILTSFSLFLFLNATLAAKETSSISSGDLGSGRIKAETVKPIKKPSAIANGDLGSGRIKAAKVIPKK